MSALILATLRNKRIALLSYLGASLSVSWLYVAIYPSLAPRFDSYRAIAEAYPPELMKAFNVDLASLTSFAGYYAGEAFSFLWPFLTIFLLVAFAGSSFAGEVEKGTMGLVLAQPVSRSRIFWGKTAAAAFGFAAYVLVSIFALVPLAALHNVSLGEVHLWITTGLAAAFGFAVFGLATAFSCIFAEKGKAYALTAGILVIMYVLNIVAALKSSLADLKYGSFFYYFNASDAFIRGTFVDGALTVFIIVGALGLATAWWRFLKRDIPV